MCSSWNEVAAIASGAGAIRICVGRKAVDVDEFLAGFMVFAPLLMAGIARAIEDGPARHTILPLVMSDMLSAFMGWLSRRMVGGGCVCIC